jgi:hypothetical protein
VSHVTVVLAVARLGWMALSSSAFAQGSINVGRKDAHVLMSSFYLHILPTLVTVFVQFVDLMLVFYTPLDGFCKGKDLLQLFCFLSTYCAMDHEKNVQLCVACINMMHGSYGRHYERHCSHMDDLLYPKTTMLM